jgi:hypothetical protein
MYSQSMYYNQRNNNTFKNVVQYKAMLWLRRLVTGLLPRRSVFAPGSVHVGFVMDKVTLGQVLLRVLRFPLSVTFLHSSLTPMSWADEQ